MQEEKEQRTKFEAIRSEFEKTGNQVSQLAAGVDCREKLRDALQVALKSQFT